MRISSLWLSLSLSLAALLVMLGRPPVADAYPAELSRCGIIPGSRDACRPCAHLACECQLLGPDDPGGGGRPPDPREFGLHPGASFPREPIGGPGPLPGEACIAWCDPDGGGPDALCTGDEYQPPLDLRWGECVTETPLVAPAECDPRRCDPAFDDLPATAQLDPWGTPIPTGDLPGVPLICMQASSPDEFYDRCHATVDPGDRRALVELLVRKHFGDAAQRACQSAPLGSLLCDSNGRYCHVTSNGSYCIQCDVNGDCHASRGIDGVGDDDPVAKAAEDEAWVRTKQRVLEQTNCDPDGTNCVRRWTCAADGESCTWTGADGQQLSIRREDDPIASQPRTWWERLGDQLDAGFTKVGQAFARGGLPGLVGLLLDFLDGLGDPNATWTVNDPDTRGQPNPSNAYRTCLQDFTCPPVPWERGRTPYTNAQPPAPTVGDPVDAATGWMVDHVVDLELGAQHGTDGLHFRFERFYSSGGVSQGVLGRNWWHNYEERIIAVNERYPGVQALPAVCSEALPMVRCAVRRVSPFRDEVYVLDGDALVFHPMAGGDRVLLHDDQPADGHSTWVMRAADGTMQGFDVHGRLRWIRDRDGNALHLRYDGDSDRLLAILDPMQREIRFEYQLDPASRWFGALVRVVDPFGRDVRYGYDAVDRAPLDPFMQFGLALAGTPPGLFVDQHRLTSATRSAPAQDHAPARVETWTYHYPSQAALDLLVPTPEPSVPGVGGACGDSDTYLPAYLDYAVRFDQLADNLIAADGPLAAIDPRGHRIVRTTYGTTPGTVEFDRVVAQQWGDDASGAPTTPTATFAYYPTPLAAGTSLPAGFLAGLAGAVEFTIATERCEDTWRRHWGQLLVVGSPEEVSASIEARAICQVTHYRDRVGAETWFGLNYLGQAVLEAHPLDDGWRFTRRTHDFAGRLVVEERAGGGVVVSTYDAASLNPLSRNNLLSMFELAAPVPPFTEMPTRTWQWAYEPLFNQPIVSTDPLGRRTVRTLDLQELDATEARSVIVTYLHRWGSTATTLAALAPALDATLGQGDVNGDGALGPIRGNVVAETHPTTTSIGGGPPQAHWRRFQYNPFGQLTRLEVAGGRSFDLTYHPGDRPTGAAVAQDTSLLPLLPRAQVLAWRTTGGLLSAVDHTYVQPRGGVKLAGLTSMPVRATFAYDLLGQPREAVGFDNAATTTYHDGFGALVRAIDAAGYEVSIGYDAAGRRVSTIEGRAPGPVTTSGDDARRSRTFYTPGGHVAGTCTELADGACALADLAALIAARAAGAPALITTYRYDAEERLIATTDGEGHTATIAYDGLGQVATTTVGNGLEPFTAAYDADGALVAETDATGVTTWLRRDGFGRVAEVHAPDGTVVIDTLDLGDRLQARRVVGADGAVLRDEQFDVDELDRVVGAHRAWVVPAGAPAPVGHQPWVSARAELDVDGQPVVITGPRGEVTRFHYDSLGRLEGEVGPTGDERYVYRDPINRSVRERRVGAGHDLLTIARLDGRGTPVATYQIDQVTGETSVATAIHDGLGLPVEATDAQGSVQRWRHDRAGRPIAIEQPIDERGTAMHTTTTRYDRRGLITELIDPSGVTTTRTWSPTGRLAIERSGRQVQSFLHDPAGRVRAILDHDSTQVSLTWEHDQLARMDAWSPRDGWSARVWSRDGLGRVTAGMSYATGGAPYHVVATRRSYDSLDHLLTERTAVGNHPERQVAYRHDAGGAVRAVTYPDGTEVIRAVDDAGHVTAIDWDAGTRHATFPWQEDRPLGQTVTIDGTTAMATAVTYDYRARPSQLVATWPGGGYREERRHDPLGRLREQAQRWDGGAPLARTRAFAYDGGGALTAEWQAPAALPLIAATDNAAVAADGAARLGTPRVFERSTTGTLLAERTGATTWYQAALSVPAGHELAAVTAPGGVAIAHDPLGRVTTDGRSTFTWTSLGLLAGATSIATGDRHAYVYDVFGRRMARISMPATGAAHTAQFVYDGWDRIATYTDGAPTARAVFGPEADHPIELALDGVGYYPVRDVQGSVVALLDATGAAVERYQYGAYGQVRIVAADGTPVCDEADGTPCQPRAGHGYTGQLRDAETGLYFYKHRYYSPALRTFLSPDPLGFVDGYDRWAYVGGDPINFTDPLGLRMHGAAGGRDWTNKQGEPFADILARDAPGGLTRFERDLIAGGGAVVHKGWNARPRYQCVARCDAQGMYWADSPLAQIKRYVISGYETSYVEGVRMFLDRDGTKLGEDTSAAALTTPWISPLDFIGPGGLPRGAARWAGRGGARLAQEAGTNQVAGKQPPKWIRWIFGIVDEPIEGKHYAVRDLWLRDEAGKVVAEVAGSTNPFSGLITIDIRRRGAENLLRRTFAHERVHARIIGMLGWVPFGKRLGEAAYRRLATAHYLEELLAESVAQWSFSKGSAYALFSTVGKFGQRRLGLELRVAGGAAAAAGAGVGTYLLLRD